MRCGVWMARAGSRESCEPVTPLKRYWHAAASVGESCDAHSGRHIDTLVSCDQPSAVSVKHKNARRAPEPPGRDVSVSAGDANASPA
ncbi:protein of unknown function [Paraburkholderia kururiensis]